MGSTQRRSLTPQLNACEQPMFQLENVAKGYGGHPLFESLTWQIPEEKCVGLVGPNGAGKTTLFRLLADEEEADQGRVVRPRQARVGYLPQELAEEYEGTVLDVVLTGRQELLDLEAQVARLEERMSQGDASEALAETYADAQDRFRREGGYGFRSKAREIAAGMGFDEDDIDQPLSTFSGGWKMRALLARLLFSAPDLLLLDEPTNHLDVESIEWLEAFLTNYDGTVVTISHDRSFLNRLVDVIAEIHAGTIYTYHGDYDHYLEEREQRRQRLIEQREQQKKEIERIQAFIDRFRYQAAHASQVQSRVKRLEKMELVEIPPAYDDQIHFSFPSPPRIGKVALKAEGVAKSYGDLRIYRDADFTLRRGDRVAFVGPNGSGKSTLLKILAGVEKPDRGHVEVGHNVDIAYFAQHSVDQLDTSRTVLAEMEAHATMETAPRIRDILGAFLFSGDDVEKPISVLSGGEKSRLALAKLLLRPAGCLLLDEPTNHLDIPSRRILEHALNEFEGAFCVISHDRYFLNEVVNRVVHIEDQRLRDFRGDYEEYRWAFQRDQEQSLEGKEGGAPPTKGGDDESPNLSRKDKRRLRAELRAQKRSQVKELKGSVEHWEATVVELEDNISSIEAILADPSSYEDDTTDIGALQRRHGELESQLMEAMEKWESVGMKLDEIEAEFERKKREMGLD